MDLEVLYASGIHSCFVSLPLHLIQTIEAARSTILSQIITLDLCSQVRSRHWNVSWSGATSISSAIEIAPKFAECVCLPNRTIVRVSILSGVENANSVTLEPESEDDWEVLELNSEEAESATLMQVKIVHEGMKFPLWLLGHNVINLHVVSTLPKKSVVQLVAGTEVAVVPKKRARISNTDQDGLLQFTEKQPNVSLALLRLQESDERFFYKVDINGGELGVALTCVAYIHPKTAQNFSLHHLQMIAVIPRFQSGDSRLTHEMENSSAPNEADNGVLQDRKEIRQAIVRLLFSDSVSKGHLMITPSLHLYLRSGLHSWVYLKRCHAILKENIGNILLSPCQFKLPAQSKAVEKNGPEAFGCHKSRTSSNLLANASPVINVEAVYWLDHEKIYNAVANCWRKGDYDTIFQLDNREGLALLIQQWALAVVDAMASAAGVRIDSLIFGRETLLHLELKCCNFGTDKKLGVQASSSNSNDSLINKCEILKMPREFLFVLSIPDESSLNGEVNGLEVVASRCKVDNSDGSWLFEKMNVGDPISLYCLRDIVPTKSCSSNISSLSWLGETASDVYKRAYVLLSTSSRMPSLYDFPVPGHILIFGPHGSGKTLLARGIAKSLRDCQDLLAHTVYVSCSGLSAKKVSFVKQELSTCISEALDHAPSLIILDDLDSIVSSSSESKGSQSLTSVLLISKFLIDIIDEYADYRKNSCCIGPIAFIASAKALENIPKSLSSSGRFDFHVQLSVPAAPQRAAILQHQIKSRSLHCPHDLLLDIASKCDGYDAYDLEILVDRAVHAAVGRFLPCGDSGKHGIPTLIGDDFAHGMHEFVPVAMRDITKSALEGVYSGWDDVGGLDDVKNVIQEMIELPSQFKAIFSQAPLRLRTNVLLYGPPGCGKTHIVGACAAACSLRFISVKGPELLNKYIGASECAVRDIFSKAAAAVPCLLFFDEFDSIAPKRGHDNTGVTDRVVNQFLTELDGIEVLNGVFVFAATSRPDLLDSALLRPGRFDRLLFCNFPTMHERLSILTVLSRKLPMHEVSLEEAACMTEGFSGADLRALLSEAQLAAVHEHLTSTEPGGPEGAPVVTDSMLKDALSKARPSVSNSEKRRLDRIYSQFVDSKKSASALLLESKGKRATLA